MEYEKKYNHNIGTFNFNLATERYIKYISEMDRKGHFDMDGVSFDYELGVIVASGEIKNPIEKNDKTNFFSLFCL